jgi:hypothetical protein
VQSLDSSLCRRASLLGTGQRKHGQRKMGSEKWAEKKRQKISEKIQKSSNTSITQMKKKDCAGLPSVGQWAEENNTLK